MDLCRTDKVRTGWAYFVDQIDILPPEPVFREIGMRLEPTTLSVVWLILVEELPTSITEANGLACHMSPHCL
jgi:hypothetical protein